jgi:hypothetical protein
VVSFLSAEPSSTTTHGISIDLLDDTVRLARTETSDVGKEVVVVWAANRLIDVDAETVDDLDEGLLEMRNELLDGKL